MVEKSIQELCSLYTEMTKRFREIRLDVLDKEDALEHVVSSDIRDYLTELLKILPRDVDIHYNNRLTIRLWHNAPYSDKKGESLWTEIILIDDNEAKECMSFNENFHDLQFAAYDGKCEYLRLNTLEFMCSQWKEIKSEVLNQTAEQLNEYILRQLERIKRKKEKLQSFHDWRVDK